MLMAPIYPLYQKDASGNNILDIDGKPKYDWGEDRPAGASAGWNPWLTLKMTNILEPVITLVEELTLN